MKRVALYGRTKSELKFLKKSAFEWGYLQSEDDVCIRITSNCEEEIRMFVKDELDIACIFVRQENYSLIKWITMDVNPIEVLVVNE